MLEVIKIIILSCQVTGARLNIEYDYIFKKQTKCQKTTLECVKGNPFSLRKCLEERK
jgi:hypothetical protein